MLLGRNFGSVNTSKGVHTNLPPKSNLGRGCQLDNDKADSIDFIQIIEQSTRVAFLQTSG